MERTMLWLNWRNCISHRNNHHPIDYVEEARNTPECKRISRSSIGAGHYLTLDMKVYVLHRKESHLHFRELFSLLRATILNINNVLCVVCLFMACVGAKVVSFRYVQIFSLCYVHFWAWVLRSSLAWIMHVSQLVLSEVVYLVLCAVSSDDDTSLRSVRSLRSKRLVCKCGSLRSPGLWNK